MEASTTTASSTSRTRDHSKKHPLRFLLKAIISILFCAIPVAIAPNSFMFRADNYAPLSYDFWPQEFYFTVANNNVNYKLNGVPFTLGERSLGRSDDGRFVYAFPASGERLRPYFINAGLIASSPGAEGDPDKGIYEEVCSGFESLIIRSALANGKNLEFINNGGTFVVVLDKAKVIPPLLHVPVAIWTVNHLHVNINVGMALGIVANGIVTWTIILIVKKLWEFAREEFF